ncbi:hypothetical protein ACQP2F_31765 [Actinoplanes sp. CA-030573]|uniref:hypothetical protein n=1 Tax=Actinoplanes sp. CA-030573 TaxID=3239898 RepID=UPI003D93CE0A
MYRTLGGATGAALALVLAAPAAAVAAPATEYTMNLSKSSAAVAAGGLASTVITFNAGPKIENKRVTLSATGLPGGVTALFAPAKPALIGSSILFLRTSSSTPVGSATITITAITISSDPIGTSATFTLNVTAG